MTYYDDRILSGSYDTEWAVELQLSGSTKRGWSGHGDIVVFGHTFTGLGTFGSISPSPETDDLSAHSRQYILNGVTPEFLIDFQKDGGGKNRPVVEYELFFDKETRDLIQARKTFVGRIDEVTVTLEGIGAAITLGVSNQLIDFGKAKVKRYTNNQQQLDHPGDRIFEYINAIQTITLNWHGTALTPNIINSAAGLYRA